jgi:transposase
MAMDMKSFRVATLRQKFAVLYYGVIQHCCSQSTILRTIHRANLSRKTMERRHIQRNDVQGVRYLDTIAHRDPLFCINIDGMACSRTDFFVKFGWAPIGDRCIYQQIVINSQFYSILAAVTPHGFLCWEIYNGTTASEQFVHFLQDRVRPLLSVDNFLVLDNARVHKTDEASAVLEAVFNGNYYFGARYSPHLMPIETCFAMVKQYIRNHEIEASLAPVRFIDKAFKRFAIGGSNAHNVYNHFRGYFENHNQFNVEMKAFFP